MAKNKKKKFKLRYVLILIILVSASFAFYKFFPEKFNKINNNKILILMQRTNCTIMYFSF